MAVAQPVDLDGGLAVDHRGDDVAVFGGGLLAHHDDVAVADRRLDHRVALDLKRKQRALPDQLAGQRQHILDVLLGQDRATGGDAAEQRHIGRGGPGGAGGLVVVGGPRTSTARGREGSRRRKPLRSSSLS